MKAVYLGLKQMLTDASVWGGPVGAETAGGLKKLKENRVDEELDNASKLLEAVHFSEAAASQEKVIDGLRQLLEVIERAQGLMKNNDQQLARDILQQLEHRQEELKNQTAEAEKKPEDLAGVQQQIAQDIAKIQHEERTSPQARQALDAAHAAAEQAGDQLFADDRQKAQQKQEQVIEKLKEAAQELAKNTDHENRDLTAQQYKQQIQDLEKAREDLQRIQKEQEAATPQAKSNPPQAQKRRSRSPRNWRKCRRTVSFPSR